MKNLAELINDLFEDYRKPNGDRYTNKEVSEALGGELDHSHLSMMRTGKATNPGRKTLLNLCRFFKVSPAYFFPELELPVDQKTAMGDMPLRAPRNLSKETQARLNAFLESLKMESSGDIDTTKEDSEEGQGDEQ